MSIHYDRKGKPLELMEWARLFENREYKLIERLEEDRDDGTRVLISTVWLGLDHNFIPDGPPLIFETMIFIEGSNDHPFDESQWRWATEEEAREGHKLVVAAYRENKDLSALISAWREHKRKEALA